MYTSLSSWASWAGAGVTLSSLAKARKVGWSARYIIDDRCLADALDGVGVGVHRVGLHPPQPLAASACS